MKQLIIIGARGFGREVYSLAKRAKGFEKDFVIKGFLDSKSDVLNDFENYPPILGNVEDYNINENDVFICALGSVNWKKFYSEIIIKKGGQFINLIERSVVINENVSIGRGCIICEHTILSNDMIIDDFTTIHPFTNFGHDVKVGKYVHIGAHCFVGGFTVIEDEVTVYVKSTLLDRVKIGKNSTIGASSLVIKNVKENTTVFGSPAKVLKF